MTFFVRHFFPPPFLCHFPRREVEVENAQTPTEEKGVRNRRKERQRKKAAPFWEQYAEKKDVEKDGNLKFYP